MLEKTALYKKSNKLKIKFGYWIKITKIIKPQPIIQKTGREPLLLLELRKLKQWYLVGDTRHTIKNKHISILWKKIERPTKLQVDLIEI